MGRWSSIRANIRERYADVSFTVAANGCRVESPLANNAECEVQRVAWVPMTASMRRQPERSRFSGGAKDLARIATRLTARHVTTELHHRSGNTNTLRARSDFSVSS